MASYYKVGPGRFSAVTLLKPGGTIRLSVITGLTSGREPSCRIKGTWEQEYLQGEGLVLKGFPSLPLKIEVSYPELGTRRSFLGDPEKVDLASFEGKELPPEGSTPLKRWFYMISKGGILVDS